MTLGASVIAEALYAATSVTRVRPAGAGEVTGKTFLALSGIAEASRPARVGRSSAGEVTGDTLLASSSTAEASQQTWVGPVKRRKGDL